jgi:hypothetical protein
MPSVGVAAKVLWGDSKNKNKKVVNKNIPIYANLDDIFFKFIIFSLL